jgi:hypothetical protein
LCMLCVALLRGMAWIQHMHVECEGFKTQLAAKSFPDGTWQCTKQ